VNSSGFPLGFVLPAFRFDGDEDCFDLSNCLCVIELERSPLLVGVILIEKA
jgi:hypothetical protein